MSSWLNYWTLFGSLVPAICNHTSCAQVYEFLWDHWRIDNNWNCTLSLFLTMYILQSSYFCRFWALCVSRVNFNQFCYAFCLTCLARFGALMSAMCNCTSFTQVLDRAIGRLVITGRAHCLFFLLRIHYAHLTFVGSEKSVCHESLLNNFHLSLSIYITINW